MVEGGEDVEFLDEAGERREEDMKSLEDKVMVADNW